jgi:Fic family protein
MADKHLRQWIWQRSGWPEFHWDAERLSRPLAAARRAQGELTGMARLLDPDSDLLQAYLEY